VAVGSRVKPWRLGHVGKNGKGGTHEMVLGVWGLAPGVLWGWLFPPRTRAADIDPLGAPVRVTCTQVNEAFARVRVRGGFSGPGGLLSA
jgi:hypothetical protein